MFKKITLVFISLNFLAAPAIFAQVKQDVVISNMIAEAQNNSQLEKLGHQLMDGIGPRLVGSPKMQQAHDWAVNTYTNWGIPARNEKWGTWKSWERGITHIDMMKPWVKTLEGMQLAWSPNTKGKTVTAEAIILPMLEDSIAYQKWLPSVKGKFVMISMLQPTGRPNYNWEEYAKVSSFEKMKKDRDEQNENFRKLMNNTGYNSRTLPAVLEKAGAVGIVTSNWSNGFGVNKIFGSYTKNIPSIDISLEDYGLLYRLAQQGSKPEISVKADSKDLGVANTYNTVAEIKGTQKPNEYVMLSAHFDSWDGGTGATDNATGTLVMMEAMRLLKKFYPNPKRTILVGHWGSEEQGLNGSRAFVEDHPEIIKNLQALFNQDNGTGRVVNISGAGYLKSYEYLGRWLSGVPAQFKEGLETQFPGSPAGGGSDNASFVAAGAPAFNLSSNSWAYGSYTWHTNRDTYDKVVFDEVRNNAILTAILVYMACEDEARSSNEKSVLPINSRTGEPGKWPEQRSPTRKGGQD